MKDKSTCKKKKKKAVNGIEPLVLTKIELFITTGLANIN